jgi:hypothetical protein
MSINSEVGSNKISIEDYWKTKTVVYQWITVDISEMQCHFAMGSMHRTSYPWIMRCHRKYCATCKTNDIIVIVMQKGRYWY